MVGMTITVIMMAVDITGIIAILGESWFLVC